MIITKNIEIKTTNKNIGHYRKYFPLSSSGDIINIAPYQLPSTSKYKIEAECDVCHKINNIIYFSYLRNVKDNKYLCQKCSHIRSEYTNLKKYGFKHPMQSDIIREKTKNTNLKKYGFEYPTQNKIIKDKKENTCLIKYGETSYMKTDKFKKDSKKIINDKYGVDYPIQNIDIRNKIKNTCLIKYGFDTPLCSNEIKEKISETKKLKYGDSNYNNKKK